MDNYQVFLNPQNIFFTIITLLLCYRLSSYFRRKISDDSYNETILKATKSSEGYSDDTVISSVFKEWWTYVISPIEQILVNSKITPNFLTVMSFLVSFLTAYLFSIGFIFSGSVVLLAGSSFDILDGRVARINQASTD